jgi:branched-subunit amino acid ABC-type transport system permease component
MIQILPKWKKLPFVSFGPEMIVATIIAMIGLSIIMTIVDKILYKPLRERKAPFMFFYMTSFGMLFVIRSIIWLIWGPSVRYYYKGASSAIKGLPFGISITPDKLFAFIIVIAVVIGIYFFQYYTKIGRGMIATSQNSMLAQICGIKIENVHTVTTIIAGAVTALAGVLYGLTVQIRPLMGWYILLGIFVVVVCGGEGAILGTLLAGYLVGVAQELGAYLLQIPLDKFRIPVSMSAYKPAIALILFIIVILFKPQGIWKGTFLAR